MKLREISPSDALTSVVLDGLEATCPILLDAEFYTKPGPADSSKDAKETDEAAEIFRALNTDNTAPKPTRDYTPVPKKIVSFDATADVTLEDRGEDPETELIQETRKRAKDVGYTLQKKFFEANAADNALEFNGMRKLAADRGNIVYANDSVDGVILPLGNSDMAVAAQQLAVEALLKFFDRVRGGASHAYMHTDLKTRWLSIARNVGYYRQSKDELGNTIDIIRDTIIRSAGYDEPGSALLPFTEPGNSSSIFACRWAEREDLTVLTSVGMKARYAGQNGNMLTNNMNMDAALHVQNSTALYQCKGWKLN